MIRIKIVLAALALTGVLALAASPRRGDQAWPPPAPKASITPIQAMAIAKKKLGGGTPFQANFEFDEGHWIYGVMLAKGHRISEVEVDPVSGRALDVEAVTASGEAREVTQELRKISATGG